MREFDEELVSGSVLRSVWKIAWPLVLLNIINGLHGFVDHVLVGHFVPSEANAANAAVGMAWQVFLVLVVFVASLYHGMNVLVARYAGRRDRERMSRVVYTTLQTSIILLVFVGAPLGYFLAPHLLDLVQPSPEEMEHALPYLRILFVGGAPIFLLFLLTGALQSSGDARTPLVLGIISTGLNIVFSAVLITGAGPFPMLGASGAAVATCLAPLVSVAVIFGLILTGRTLITFPSKPPLLPDFSVLKPLARIGIPTGIQGFLLNLAGVILLRYIGMLDEKVAARAAYTICYTQLFSFVAWPSWALRNAAGAIMGQNLGANQLERARRSTYVASGLGLGWAIAMGLVFFTVPEHLLALFNATDPAVEEKGVDFLRYLTFSGVFLTTALAFTGGLTGAGDTVRPMYIAFVSQIGILLGLCQAHVFLGTLTPQAIWSSILIAHASRFVITFLVFRRGKWEKIKVELEE